MASSNHIQSTTPKDNANQNQLHNNHNNNLPQIEEFEYSQRAQWLRAPVLGANDGFVSIASLVMGVGAIKNDVRTMIHTGFDGLFAGAWSMAIGVYSKVNVELTQMKREKRSTSKNSEENAEKEKFPNSFRVARASTLACFLEGQLCYYFQLHL
ncbi:hypothetical protein BUALT_Bualt19G0090100 [Buddleja alternifolia]|uniref:Vacuolar iron transporter n=1 Tax=Buddleja alternifolia TaxID=168488 RepID=A0AAV6WAL4_9LAMI|nr:hypothetical protein BUALT_Bualt19G0090100 [Buddleja alternifolia]